MTLDPTNSTHNDLELLAFRVGEQEYSVDIMKVREIRGWSPATSLPHAPEYVCGVINLRGAVLPIVDLSARLGMAPIEATSRNVIIVMQLETQTLGILVDAVSDILTLQKSDIQPPPELANAKGSSFISGLTIIEERMIRVIDLAGVLPETGQVAA
jgi:purine-binding chemotaxis protein CheW